MSKDAPKNAPKNAMMRNASADFLIFSRESGAEDIEVRFDDETVWLTQKQMAELFDVKINTINEHLKNIFETAELSKDSVIRKFRITASDGKDYSTQFYNLDAIISVGYRVNSKKATQFRRWATNILRQFTMQGYVLDRKRLESGHIIGEDYFERLLTEIREIRLSERYFYQKITDIYATSVDYDKDSPVTQEFFAKVQNKLHYAIHGNTASELIKKRADSTQPNMGLTSWDGAPQGKIVKADVGIAKNYLKAEELQALGRVVDAYLNLAEDRASRHIPMTMEDWSRQLDQFLQLTERDILKHAGNVSAKIAKQHAEGEFEKYRIIQDKNFESDFDKAVKAVGKKNKDDKSD